MAVDPKDFEQHNTLIQSFVNKYGSQLQALTERPNK